MAYIYMMLIKPWVDGHGRWAYVQGVWAYWQTLNAAMLAFLASLFAVYAARYHENQSRTRQLLAARAILPQALSDLTTHVSALASFYSNTYRYWNRKEHITDNDAFTTPKPPEPISNDIANALSNCMMFVSSPKQLHLMANVLSMNQYITSRAWNGFADESQLHEGELWTINTSHQLLELAEMYSYVSRLFDYGRDLESELDITELKLREVENSMLNLGINEFEHKMVYQMMAEKYNNVK
ncbi:hypothetical protein O4H50_10995 [Vibrio diazotrophicus]|uniref:hypothetical protein n=1 Tax=Vibrio diazotrophicus TaxID=685 RepID=UPI0022AF922A|nr:hypothetical protein [Vibrio diazotrophicus]MCZ4372319.1 hypothetical protein [Vibrio diazotrophicus]